MVTPALKHLLKERASEISILQRNMRILEETTKAIIDGYIAPGSKKAAYKCLDNTLRIL